jgi:phospho-N-acetylmuramoyl-pentapeptide-transferase
MIYMIFPIAVFISSCIIYYIVRKFNILSFVQPQRDFIVQAREKSKLKPIPCAGIIFFLFFTLYSILNDSIDYKFITISGFFLIGLVDDVIKVFKKSHITNFSGRKRIILEILLSIFFVYNFLGGNAYLLTFREWFLEVPVWFAYFLIPFIIIGTVNAVNLTDGQDALAGKVVLVNLFFLIAVFGMNGQLLILIFAILAFLLFNSKPATIYMGDSGSLFLGGFLSVFFITHKIEALLPVTGIIFVLEAVSVILQVYYFKLTKGKRIFKMSPLHHHFELSGVSEEKTVNIAFVVTIISSFIAYFLVGNVL